MSFYIPFRNLKFGARSPQVAYQRVHPPGSGHRTRREKEVKVPVTAALNWDVIVTDGPCHVYRQIKIKIATLPERSVLFFSNPINPQKRPRTKHFPQPPKAPLLQSTLHLRHLHELEPHDANSPHQAFDYPCPPKAIAVRKTLVLSPRGNTRTPPPDRSAADLRCAHLTVNDLALA